MGNNNAQIPGSRIIVDTLDQEFARLHARLRKLIKGTPATSLYERGPDSDAAAPSVGEHVLRSAAVVEMTFGGITANLWDDPFEWTLPEHLSTPAKLIEHLKEVESLRQRAFESFNDDSCLTRQVATPSDATQPLARLLVTTLVRAAEFHAHAVAAHQRLFGIAASGFII